MSAIYESQLTGDEREFMSDIAGINLEIAKYSTMLEMVDMKLETELNEAEVKVFKESGNYDDLEYLYEEANNEAEQKKTGIVSSIVTAVKNLFGKISNFIKTKILKMPVSGEVELDQSDIDNANNIKTAFNGVKDGLNKVKDGATEHPWIVNGAIAGSTALAVVAAFKIKEASGKKVKKSAEEAKKIAEEIDTTVNQPVQEAMSRFEKYKNSNNIVVSTISKAISGFGSQVSKFVTNISGKLKTAGVAVKDGAEKAAETAGNVVDTAKEKINEAVNGKTEPAQEPKKESLSDTKGKKPSVEERNMTKEEYAKQAHAERVRKRNEVRNRYGKNMTEEEFNKGYKEADRRYEQQEAAKKAVPTTDAEKEEKAKKNIEKTKERLMTKENKEKLEQKKLADDDKESGNMELQNLLKGFATKKLHKGRFTPGKNRHNIYTKVNGRWQKFTLTNAGGFDDDPHKWVVGNTHTDVGKEQPAFESVEEVDTVYENECVLSVDEALALMESDEAYENALYDIVMQENVEEFFVSLEGDVYNEYVTAVLEDEDAEPMTESQDNSLLGYNPEVELSIYEESALNEEINSLVMAFDAL